jgi:hypothetical protein
MRTFAGVTDCGSFRVCAKDDRFIACAAALQIFSLFGTRHAHRTNPQSKAFKGKAHRCRRDRRVSVLGGLNGKCAKRGNDLALWALHAARCHQQRLRTARSKHIVSASTVQVHINIARDDQPLDATCT